MADKFVFGRDVAAEQVGEGVSRKVLAHSDNMMVVEIHFQQGGIGTPHTHPHEQVTYIISGKFRFTNDGETKDVGPGDTLRFEPNTEHGTLCLEEGYLVDIFTPSRQDFLK